MKISSLILSLLCIFCVSGFFFWKQSREICTIPGSTGEWRFEIARTPSEQEKGLMNRKNLCEKCGMLFIFEREISQVFWMRNTLIPLDIYFYDSRGILVDVARNMRPEYETQSPMLYRSKPAKYVLEVNAGSELVDFLPEKCD